MEPRIETLTEKKLIGRRIKMSLSNIRTGELWRTFMPRRKEILNNVTADLFSLEVYDKSFDFKNCNDKIEFDKWAAVEVSDFNIVPADMETYTLPGGLYAVFIHKGPADTGLKSYQYIFGTWVPKSNFEIDSRAHFALMGAKYKNNAADSEEEIWIPVKRKE